MKSKQESAFTLLELLMVMAVLSILLTGISMIFIETSRVARVQTQQAALQQNQRSVHQELSRMVRMAGLGGLPITWTNEKSDLTPTYATTGSFPDGFALGLVNNVTSGTQVGPHFVLPGSDMLTIRGVFTTPVYYLRDRVRLEDAVVAGEISNYFVEVSSRAGAFDLPLTPLIDRVKQAIDDTEPLAFILRDLQNPDAYVIMELWPATTDLTEYECDNAVKPSGWPTDPGKDGRKYCIRIGLQFKRASANSLPFGNLSMGNKLDAAYGNAQVDMPGGGTKPKLEIPVNVQSIGLLEEFKYYVRPSFQIPGDQNSRFSPILTRAELLPGTDTVLNSIDIARDIIDVQYAVGIDTSGEILGTGFNEVEDLGSDTDEVLFNSDQDTLTLPSVLVNAGIDPPVYFHPDLDFQYLRVTTVSQLPSPTQGQWVPRLGEFEDHDLSLTKTVDGYTYNFNTERNVPRTYHQSYIELRNLR